MAQEDFEMRQLEVAGVAIGTGDGSGVEPSPDVVS